MFGPRRRANYYSIYFQNCLSKMQDESIWPRLSRWKNRKQAIQKAKLDDSHNANDSKNDNVQSHKEESKLNSTIISNSSVHTLKDDKMSIQ